MEGFEHAPFVDDGDGHRGAELRGFGLRSREHALDRAEADRLLGPADVTGGYGCLRGGH